MRGVLGETIIGFPVADAKTPADALRFTEKLLAALPQRSAGRARPWRRTRSTPIPTKR